MSAEEETAAEAVAAAPEAEAPAADEAAAAAEETGAAETVGGEDTAVAEEAAAEALEGTAEAEGEALPEGEEAPPGVDEGAELGAPEGADLETTLRPEEVEQAGGEEGPPVEEEGEKAKKRKPKKADVPVNHLMSLGYTITKSGGTVVGAGADPDITDAQRLDMVISGLPAARSSMSGQLSGLAALGPSEIDVEGCKNALEADRLRYERRMQAMQKTTSSLRQSQERFSKVRPALDDDAVRFEEGDEEEDEEWQRQMEEEDAKEQELAKWFPSVRKSMESRKSQAASARKSQAAIAGIGMKHIVHEWCVKALDRALTDED